MGTPLIVGIDTTGPKGEVGLFGGKTKRIVRRSTEGHAEWVLPAIDELLRKGGKSLKDVSAIVVRTGPGSFTGTRVGVTIGNALSWALGVPIFGVTNDQASDLEQAVTRAGTLFDKGERPRFARPKYPLLPGKPS